ncbi:MAG: restriction endonuclease [Lachnospiraceae bacterium]|nr:restriction endonuclease [Lachnospiraceae bacterium]
MDCVNNNRANYDDSLTDENVPYRSQRLIIKGLHIYFIDVAREIVEHNSLDIIPLMREYHLTESEVNQIIADIREAKILDSSQNVTMTVDEFEKFIDIYEPSIFECTNSVFDKEIFMCLGEIIFDKGVKDTYNSLPADEVIDYLNIMERLKIIAYDDYRNEYDILTEKTDYERICKCIPNFFRSKKYDDSESNYDNADFDNMSGLEFEKYCAHILLQNGFCEIKLTPPSGDHGIDILASKNDVSYAIQCKCYSSNVGNDAIQQAHTGKSLYHRDIAVVITNRYFTPQAAEEADALGVKLWDRDKLNEMINGGFQ